MIKQHYFLGLILLAVAIIIPTLTSAQEIESETEANASINAGTNIRTDSVQQRNNRPTPRTQQEIQAELRLRADARASSTNRIGDRPANRPSSTTQPLQRNPNIRNEQNDIMMKLSSSTREENKEMIKEIKTELHRDIFIARKNAIIRQLNVALNNLKQIRTRISSHIKKSEESGRNMTVAKNLLIVADTKINLANEAILKLDTNTSANASTTVDLMKPRQVAETAIKAIKDAHKALVDVVKAIAKDSGLGNASSTRSIKSDNRVEKNETGTNIESDTTESN